MNYSVKELREHLVEKISKLGINEKFKENPAFETAIAKIKHAIARIDMFQNTETVTVTEENGKIFFTGSSNNNDKYSINIQCTNPNEFKCTVIEERAQNIDNDKKTHKKNITSQSALIDENSSFITLITNGVNLDDTNCETDTFNQRNWTRKDYYTAEGIMSDQETKLFASNTIHGNIETINDNILSTQSFANDNCEAKVYIKREMLDTATISVDDKKEGIIYIAKTLLNSKQGLSNMIVGSGNEPYPKDVIINPLSPSEIEALIKKESNPKIAEGLRKFTAGRDTYSYNSNTDPNFKREGTDKLKETFEKKENTNSTENITK